MAPPSCGGVDAVASWVHQAFVEDFGKDIGSNVGHRATAVIKDNDISLRVFRSLEKDDITELFDFMSFGQKRTIKLLVKQANQHTIQEMPAPPDTSPSQPTLVPQLPPSATPVQSPSPVIPLSCSQTPTHENSPKAMPVKLPEVNQTGEGGSAPNEVPIPVPLTSTTPSPAPRNPRVVTLHFKSDPGPSPGFKTTPITPTTPEAVRNTPSASESSGSDEYPRRDDIICPSPSIRTKRGMVTQHHSAKRFCPNEGTGSTIQPNQSNLLSPGSRQPPVFDMGKKEFFVCIVGPSGVGKSSALNAVLDGYNVLPTSSMRASTAVPIEIRYKQTKAPSEEESDNDEMPFAEMQDEEISQFLTREGAEDKRFIVEIDFITKESWEDILRRAIIVLQRKEQDRRNLQRILMLTSGAYGDDEARKAAMEQHCRSQLEEDAAGEAALAAVRAVLGETKFLSMDGAVKACDKPKVAAILKNLGQSLRFSFDKYRDVSRRIERFLATSTNRRSAAVWPLVKSARIYGPWKLLSGGMVLVDLPGLQDANSARNQVVSSYIHRCHAIISAARISRARDNKTTHDLLTGPIRAGIESGRVTFVGFIATHSDDIKPTEIVEELHKSFSQNFRDGLRQAGVCHGEDECPSINDIRNQVSRLALLRSSTGDLEDFDALNDELVANRHSQIEELSRNLRSRCIVARNGFVGRALEDQFKQEMESMPKIDIPPFQVFCVSSTQYTSIMREHCADVSRDFTDVRFTGMPGLCDRLWSLSKTTQATRELARRNTEAAFRPRSDEMTDEPAVEDREELRRFLRSVLQECEGDEDADAERIRADLEKKAEEAAAAREAELSDTDKRVQSRSSYLKQIISLNETGAGALITFLERCRSSTLSIASDRRIEMWLDQAREHKEQTEAKGAMIAILGDSGSGKSSLLNALLDADGDDVLPVSGVRACTAAPVEITYSGVGGYRAEIEFLGQQEWHDELRQLISDLEEATKRELKSRMLEFERPRSELGRIAYDKIFSVYGRIASYKTLTEGTCSVEDRLGTTAKLQAFSAEGIRQQLEAYCSSRSDGAADQTGRWGEAGRLWPLVRVAHLKGPFKVLSDSGGCLLDLPGLQDSNAARNTVVQSYLGSCSGFIIAAPIKRAVDNRTARELLGRQFRRQLLLDGRISSVAFAATQTDDIDALQVAAELGLQGLSTYSGVPESEVMSKFSKHAKKISKTRKRIKALAKKKANFASRLKKEKIAPKRATRLPRMMDLDEDDEDHYDQHRRSPEQHLDRAERLESQISEVQATISGLNSELAKREHVLNNICSLARNEYCRLQVREDFVEGIQEITDRAFATDQGVSSEGPPQLPVFTTSSSDFRHLNQTQTKHAKAFYSVDETGIPKLYQFVRHNMLISRISAESRRTERLAVLLSSVSQYLLMENRATASQQAALVEKIAKILSGIDTDANLLSSQAMNQLNRILLDGPMKKTLTLGEVKARENASSNLVKVEGSVHWATYRACLRRLGVYVSPTAGPLNLNESLMAPLMETVIPSWREAFGTGVSKILQSFVANATKLADSTLAAVAKEVALSGLSATPLEGAGELRLIAKKSFDMALSETRKSMETKFEKLQRNCWRDLPQTVVQTALIQGYTKANDERGTGCVARLKDHMRSEVRHRRSVMFDKCVMQINASVKGALKNVSTMTSSMLRSYFVGLLDDIEVLWDSQCDLSREKCVCLANALKNLTRLVEKIRIGSLALKKSIYGVDFDANNSSHSVLPVLDDTLELASLPLIDEKVVDNIIPLETEAGYWRKVKLENQLHTSSMPIPLDAMSLDAMSSQESVSESPSSSSTPSSYSDEDW